MVGRSDMGKVSWKTRSPWVRGVVPVISVRLAGMQTGHSAYVLVKRVPLAAN